MNSDSGLWEVRVRKPAKKSLRRAPRHECEWLLKALDEMQHDPKSGNVKRLSNEVTAFRRRVGDWRIFFDLYPGRRRVDVALIERRTTTTYRHR